MLQMKNRLLLWYSWAYMLDAQCKTYIKHEVRSTRRIDCWNGCAGTRPPSALVFLTDRRQQGVTIVGFCQALHLDLQSRISEKSAEDCILSTLQYWYGY